MLKNNNVDLTTIIVSYNTADLLPQCINALAMASSKVDNKIIIIDNASRDNSVELLKRDFSSYKLIFNTTNVGFGRANNQCVDFIQGKYVLLLNTDAFVSEDTLEKTMKYMEDNPKCGVLGVKLLGREGDLQPSCRYFPNSWAIFLQATGLQRFFKNTRYIDDMSWSHNNPRQCDWVPGCYYLIRREVIDDIGLFDPRYFLYYEEVDHCFAVKKAGWQVHFFSDSSVIHIGGESAKSEGSLTSTGNQLNELKIESELLYFHKNHGALLVFMHVLLLTLANMINFCKVLIKSKGKTFDFVQSIILVWSLYFKTKLGRVPTR